MLRGKCKELSEEFISGNPEYVLVAGFYHEPMWTGKEKQEHWWCKHNQTGKIYDPTSSQFPSGGVKEFYTEFTGSFECEECGIEKHQDDMLHEGRFHFCSGECYCRCVGII